MLYIEYIYHIYMLYRYMIVIYDNQITKKFIVSGSRGSTSEGLYLRGLICSQK